MSVCLTDCDSLFTVCVSVQKILAKEIRSLRMQLDKSNVERSVYKAQIQALRDTLLTATTDAAAAAAVSVSSVVCTRDISSNSVINNDNIN